MRATRLVASKVRATCCQPPLVMPAAVALMTCGARLVSQILAQSEPEILLLPGKPPSQNWTPCGEGLGASFHSTSGPGKLVSWYTSKESRNIPKLPRSCPIMVKVVVGPVAVKTKDVCAHLRSVSELVKL